MTQEALKLALEALNDLAAWNDGEVGGHMDEPYAAGTSRKAITAIKEALVQTQEPVAWFRYQQGSRVYYDSKKWDDCQPLYTSPPQRTQVDLTDEEVFGLFGRFTAMTGKSWLDLYRMTEAKRKEKNT